MIGLLILALISVIFLYFMASYLSAQGTKETVRLMHQGVLQTISEQLQIFPEKDWFKIIKQLQPQEGEVLKILPLSEAKLSKNQKNQVLQGKFVVLVGKETFYFGYGVQEFTSCLRIGQTPFVLELKDISILRIASIASAWMVSAVQFQLDHTPQTQWGVKLKNLENFYGFPLVLLPKNYIPENILFQLKKRNLALSDPKKTNGKIKYAYANLSHTSLVLRLGPIPYPMYIQYRLVILVLLFSVISIVFVIVLTLIFSKNLDKIYRLTSQYSSADFLNTVTPVSKNSTLYTLYCNIINMGQKIKNLISSQKQLTRFIAHECRTPVSTMLFAIDQLEKIDLPQSARENILSIKEDLADLQALVDQFLEYARYSSEGIILNLKLVDVNLWFTECVKKYEFAPKKVELISQISCGKLIKFDPELFKHVIYNLINNGLHYANSIIRIEAIIQDGQFCIYVDDDGMGLTDLREINLFAPFSQLDPEMPGFGLGLSIAESIVSRHHGVISISNSPLGGARFTVQLPCYPYS